MEKVFGVDSYLIYGVETTYGTAATTIASVFGFVKSFKASETWGLNKTYGSSGAAADRAPAQITSGTYENSLSVELEPLYWSWLEYVMGTVSGAGTAASPYVYVIAKNASSITLSHCIDNVTTDRESLYLGCMIKDVTIRASVGETVSVTLNIIGADVDKDSTLTTRVALTDVAPFTFVDGSFELPDGTAISNIIDSFEITISTGAKIRYGLGSAFGQIGYLSKVDYSVKVKFAYFDDTVYDLFLGGAAGAVAPTENANMALKFEKTANRTIDFVFTKATIGDFNVDGTLHEVIDEDISIESKSLIVTEVQTES